MSVYLIGGNRTAITVGMTLCERRGAVLPYIAFAPSEDIMREMNEDGRGAFYEDVDDVRRSFEVFERFGTVIFIDNANAADRLMTLLDNLLSVAAETRWVEREFQPEVLQ